MVKDNIIRYYYRAKECVYENGYYTEIYWQERQNPDTISLQKYYSEYAWVVLSSGMKESVIRNKFYAITNLFKNWNDPFSIVSNRKYIKEHALQLFNNLLKINALIYMGEYLSTNCFKDELANIRLKGFKYLEQFPFLGPATSLHFAKNLGFIVSKPDRHLNRISNKFGFEDSLAFCRAISQFTGEKESVIDIVLWRFATLNKNYLLEASNE
jgi:hypothetical protein